MTKYRETDPVSRQSQPNQHHALSCNASKTLGQQGAKGSERTEPHMAIDSKLTDPVLCGLFASNQKENHYPCAGLYHIRKELLQ